MSRPVWRSLPHPGMRAGHGQTLGHARPWGMQNSLEVGVPRAQHRGKARGLHLAALALARLLKMPVVAHFFERALPVDFLLQSPQRLIDGLAFF